MSHQPQLVTTVVQLTTDGRDGASVQKTVQVGDTVHVAGVVTRIVAEQYTVSIHTRGGGPEAFTVDDDQVVAVEVPDPPAEPDNGTWVIAPRDAWTAERNLFERDDANAPVEAGRRWPRRWYNMGSGEWNDWPTVIARGGDPDRRLVPAERRTVQPDLALHDAVVRVMASHPRGLDAGSIADKVRLILPEATGGRVLDVLRLLEQAHIVAHVAFPEPEGQWVYLREGPVQHDPSQPPLPNV